MRRSHKLLCLLVITLGLTGWATLNEHQVNTATRIEGGWDGNTDLKADNLLLDSIPNSWKGLGEGKTRLLYRDYEAVHGHPYTPRSQGSAPSCVGQAAAAGADFLAPAQIIGGANERAPVAGASAEVIYGLSRVEIGQIPPGFGGGSHCLWAAQAMQQYGVVPQLYFSEYGIDLSEPSPRLAIEFGKDGCPDPLEEEARKHPVLEYIQVRTYEDLRDAIFKGCPVIVGSNVGFGAKSGIARDSDGFLSPPRGWFARGKVWRHAMCFIGVSDEGRKGALLLNSWGPDWVKGPKRFDDCPEGTFFVDAAVVDRMLSQGDSFALHYFIGYSSYKLW